MTNDQNNIEFKGVKAEFIPSNRVNTCCCCCFRSKCEPGLSCTEYEREDKQNGYFVLAEKGEKNENM